MFQVGDRIRIENEDTKLDGVIIDILQAQVRYPRSVIDAYYKSFDEAYRKQMIESNCYRLIVEGDFKGSLSIELKDYTRYRTTIKKIS